MSLSKYYKSTNSFQQEKLVKEEFPQEKGWSPSPRQSSAHFAPQSTEFPQTTPLNSEEEAAPPSPSSSPLFADKPPQQEPVIEGMQEEVPPSFAEFEEPVLQEYEETIPQIPSQPEIDLSQYIEISEAQTQIEAAYEEGVQTGIRQAEEDYGSAIKALNNICTQLNTLQETIIKNSSGELLEFALAITERILRFSVANQDTTIVATIEEALQKAVRSEEFTIYLHPEDLDIIKEKSADIIAGVSGLDKIVVKSDPSVERGGAKLESDNCSIDATIASQFETIRDEIIRCNNQ